MLTGTTWSVDWNVPVDKDLNGSGKAVETKAIQDLLKDGPDVSLTAWSLDPKTGETPFEAFSTQADAMKRTPAQLLGWLFAAREHDPIVLQEHLRCARRQGAGPLGRDQLRHDRRDLRQGRDVGLRQAQRRADQERSRPPPQQRRVATVKVGWSEAIGSAAGLTPGTAITVELFVGELDVKIVTVPFPFKSGGEVAPGTGKYKVGLSV